MNLCRRKPTANSKHLSKTPLNDTLKVIFIDLGFAAIHGEEESFSPDMIFVESGCCHLLSTEAK